MLSFFRVSRAASRSIFAALLAVSFAANVAGIASAAGTTGNVTGSVTDKATGKPLPGVMVSLISPSGRAKATTDAKGFYSFTGLIPDSYTVAFELQGYQPLSITGINVFPDNTAEVDEKLEKSLRTLVQVSARGSGGAFQPDQTGDTYTVDNSQIQTIQGKDNNTNEVSLLTSLPGASLDSSGYPVLRGGRENEEGYEFEGISIVDSFTNQFTNSLSVNGINNFQLTPGAGNASNGNAGTGTINYTSKRGTYPGTGSLELDAASYPYYHQFEASYGLASPDGHISDYFSFIGQRNGSQYGQNGVPAAANGEFYGVGEFSENNLVNNFIFKFGKNDDTELQLLYQNQIDYFNEAYGGFHELLPVLTDPYYSQVASVPSLLTQIFGISSTDLEHALEPVPGHSNTQPYGYDAQYQPESLYKIQLSHNFSSSAFLRAAYYGVDAVSIFDFPDPGDDFYAPQGSLKHGGTVDFTDQVDRKNLFQTGVKYEYNRPVFAFYSPIDAVLAAGLSGFGVGSQGFEIADFLPNDAGCQFALQQVYGLPASRSCGYILGYKPGAQLPLYDEDAEFDRADYATYVTDQFQASRNFKVEGGVRFDGSDTKFPGAIGGNAINIPQDTKYPKIIEPRIAASLELTKHDAIRASFARSVQFPPLGDADYTISRSSLNAYNNIPSYNVLTGGTAYFCGPKSNQPCANYADQLYSEYQAVTGVPVQPIVPEQFSNFDFSYSHQFPENIEFKVTPFYTRGYDIVDTVSNVIGKNPATNEPIFGPPLATNLGAEYTSGIEFLLTREAKYGFSGQLSATYLNKFSNVPALSRSEDFFPTIPSASLQLGDLYRVGYLSPFQATLAVQEKTKSGIRINPQITYIRGYPYNPGLTTAAYVNGVPYNLPLTNVTGAEVGSSPSQFVDPINPGTVYNPNVDATLGTPETKATGGLLSNAHFTTNLTIEYSPPGSRSTFGAQIFNLFDQLFASVPSLNGQLQPVATGVLGPQSGKLLGYQYPYSIAPYNLPYFSATPSYENGQSPYTFGEYNTPLNITLYYELKI